VIKKACNDLLRAFLSGFIFFNKGCRMGILRIYSFTSLMMDFRLNLLKKVKLKNVYHFFMCFRIYIKGILIQVEKTLIFYYWI
ncbi:hypothetical protein, partial [Bacillus wiedmannii]|uniref:hypothetical protein n=1 Tax=Bacillus wiedmannii TaxID=1890302 RepID=UPI001C551387